MQGHILSNARTLRKINSDLHKHMFGRGNEEICLQPDLNKNTSTKIKIKPGTIIEDQIPSETLKLVVVPIKKIAPSNNISDEAFESMGDQMPDTLDFEHEQNYTGVQASNKIKNFGKEQKDRC